ncbi:MAG: hypothetical protein R2911_31725 [Caldilineaceae bacterium]
MTTIKVMADENRFTIVYHSRLNQHIRAIERRHHALIRKTIEQQLSYEADTETRNRKPVRQPFLFDATWEIRFGPENRFRVFYEVDHNHHAVNILAIGEKKGNRLFIAGEEVAP